jgi:exodeoxyribonuclease VII large subunit
MPEGFFDTHARLTAKKAGVPPPGSAATPLTVTQLTKQIDRAIKSGVPATVLVKGELSNFRSQRTASGHLYFTLKDPSACIDCVMWQDAAARLKFKLVDGLEVLAEGRVGIYGERGKYQLYVNSLSPIGQGALELAFQQLRAKLEKEGLFSSDRKQPLPRYPLRIAIVTSSATAALQDILKVFKRFTWLQLALYNVPVQGEGSGEKIAAALADLNTNPNFDIVVLARGGGSLEDLRAFNEESVARAMVASRIPIITGIGHEVDISIADLVADYHAHTPTEAAQIVTARWRNAADLVGITAARLNRGLRQIMHDRRQRLLSIARHELFRRPLDRINVLRQLLDERQRALIAAASASLRRRSDQLTALSERWWRRHPRQFIALRRSDLEARQISLRKAIAEDARRRLAKLDAVQKHLHAIGPQQVLRRGYTITTRKKDSRPLRKPDDIKIGEVVVTQFADGTIESIVSDPRQPSLF